MTTLPMSIFDKIKWFIVEPLFSILFERDEVLNEILTRRYIGQMEEKGFHFNRKKDGEDIGRP